MTFNLRSKPIEIFCGTGGVGKTTLATSRALYLASKGKRVLLITIDPAHRLKEILGLSETNAGKIETIKSDMFEDFAKDTGPFEFHALLMSPSTTLHRMGEKNDTLKDFENHIIKTLTKPYGGMNEIMAIIEVQHHLNTARFDCIVLDTPPGNHFLDFLQASQKIKNFFDKSFVEIFRYLGKAFKSKNSKDEDHPGIVGLLISTGVKKLLGYLEKVTGAQFVNEFVDAIIALYKNKDSFLDALKFQEELQLSAFSNWFLVTSVEQQKFLAAMELQEKAKKFMHGDSYLIINKCLADYIQQWVPAEGASGIQPKLKASMLERENRIKNFAGKMFEKTLDFSEVLDSSALNQVCFMAKNWKRWS